MARNILVNCIEGFSASIRPDKDTLSEVVLKYVRKYNDNILDFNEGDSSSSKCIEQSVDFIETRKLSCVRLFLVGKSLGGVKTFRLLKNHFDIISSFQKVVVMLIDAHSPFPTFIGNFRNLKIKDEWKKKNMMYVNVYQKNKYPKGASLKNSSVQSHLLAGADHWNIINNTITKQVMDDSFKYLIK